MIKNIIYLGLELSNCPSEWAWKYNIIDENFEEEVRIHSTAIDLVVVVSQIYAKRNLPVAPNIIRTMLWLRDNCRFSLNDQFSWHKANNNSWHEVEKDVKKYLLFS